MMNKLLDLYSDYLLCSTRQTSATGLSVLSDGAVSHDKVTRFLSGHDFDSKSLWMAVKPLIRQHESEAACLVFDDTIIEKQYMDENELICWHWDHSKGRNIKGINILSAFYVSPLPASEESLRVPLAYETVKKTVVFSEVKTRKQKRQSSVSRNEMMRQMMLQQIKIGRHSNMF